MIHQFRVNKFLFLLLAVICSLPALAGVEPYQNQLKGAIKKGDSLIVKDEKFRNVNFDWNEITNRTVKNYVSLQLTYDTPIVLNKPFSCEVDLKIEYYSTPDQAEPMVINSVKLKVNFSPDTGATYKAKDVYSFSNGYLVKITVNNISSPEMGENIPPVLQLTNQVVIDRQYKFHPEQPIDFNGSIITNTTTEAGNNMKMMAASMPPNTINCYWLYVAWTDLPGAEEYDLEWAVFDEGTEQQGVLNQVMNNQAVPNEVLNELFRNNATRITTHEQTYYVTMAYNAKYIMVRIRQVHYNTDGYRDEAPWTYQVSGAYRFWPIDCWHEEKLNWEYSATFAEEGKKKEILSYFDGSLRNRQLVTINNSDQVAVVQEKVYDEFGRAAADILPAPTDDDKFHFFPNFNRNINNTTYDYRNLNQPGTGCETIPAPLNENSGAARYYSAQNPFLPLSSPSPDDPWATARRKYNNYIPKAEGYPISVTQFTNDNTGRIRVQGGVGPKFQPGATDRHVTKYYYGKPETWELDRLFGNDVGYANHYQKNMVVDPNGQISVSYINAAGKTIATALTGKAADGMDALPSNPGKKQETFTILRPQQFVFDATALSLKAKTTYLSSVENATAVFNYNIQELVYTYQGTSKQGAAFQVCSNCFYEMNIRITDDCGTPVYSITTPIKIGTETGNCNYTPQTYQPFSCDFKNIGEYYISFELTLSRKVIEDYTNAYIRQRNDNHSLKTEMDFIFDYLKDLDINGCFNECNTCEGALGTEAQFTQAVVTTFGKYGYEPAQISPEIYTYISGLYNTLRSNCLALRATCMVSSCSKYEKAMLEDVSPGGQYALFSFEPFTTLEPNTNVIAQNWRPTPQTGIFPARVPGTTEYEAEKFTDENGNTTSPYDGNFTLEMLIRYWKDEWATKFLQFHPEKCKLDFCNANSNYIMWDDQVQQFINKAADIPNIPGTSGLAYSYTNGAWLLAQDPFFRNGAPGAAYRSQMEADLNYFSTNIMNVTAAGANVKGLTAVIDYLMYCADVDGSTNSNPAGNSWNDCSPVANCRVPDKEWNQYKDMYFQLKQKYYQIVRNNTSCAGKCCEYRLQNLAQKLSANKFSDVSASGTETIYTIVPGQENQPPADAAYCTNGTITIKEFHKCYRIFMPGSNTPYEYYNVWVIGCSRDFCANAPVYTMESQLSPYKFYANGRYYYVTLRNGGGTAPECEYSPDYKPCIKVAVGGNTLTFVDASINSCSICAWGEQNIYAKSQLATNVYELYNTAVYQVFPNTPSNYNPGGSSYCSNPVRDWFPCFNVTVNGTTQTFYNATVLYCPPGSTCNGVQGFAVSSGGGGYYSWTDGMELYEYHVSPYDPNYPPPYPCGPDVNSAGYMAFTGDQCAWFYFNNGQPHEYWKNVYVYECQTIFSTMQSGQSDLTVLRKQYETAETHVIKDYNDHSIYLVKKTSEKDKATWQKGRGTDSGMTRPARVKDFGIYRYRRIFSLTTGKNVYSHFRDVWVATYMPKAVAKPENKRTGKNLQPLSASSSDAAITTLSATCPNEFKIKKSRFPEFNYNYNQDLQAIQDENNALISGQIQTSCEAQADKWIQQLEKCLLLYPGQENALRTKLIQVCMNGGDIDHPYGSSTIRPGATGTASFKQAIIEVLGLSALTMTCNPWLIDEPHPYAPKQQSVSKTLGNTNASLCTRLQQLITDAGGSNLLYNYLKNKYGDAMNLTSTQLNMLVKSCNNCRYILEEDIPLPVFMEPGTVGCITKADYDNAKAELATEMGGNLDVNHENYPDLLTNFLNHRWGFSMAYHRYLDYETKLQSNQSAILCNNVPYTEVAVDQYVCLKSLVESAIINGQRDYVVYIEEEKRKFRVEYIKVCSQTQGSAQITTEQQTYHYTLYYYDQAGNLIRTVSPEGVRPLTEQELPLVDEYRKQGNVVDCSAFNSAATETKSIALSRISTALQSGNGKSLELWLNGSGPTRHVRFVTPDNRFFYQAAIADNKLWVELYSLQPGTNGDISITLSNNAVADISTIQVQRWSHLVVEQATDFAGGQWTLYLDNHKLTLLPGSTLPPYPFEWEISSGPTVPADVVSELKHIRLYDRLLTDPEISADFYNQCQAPEGQLSVSTSPLIVWGRFNLPSMCNNTANTRQVGNRGALNARGNLNGSQTNSFSSITNTFTVEMWVNPDAPHEIDAESQTGTAGMSGQKYAIYPTQYSAASGTAGMGISVGTNGVSVYENADSYMPPLLVWQGTITGWKHIAVVYNNKVPSLYIDGQFVKSGVESTKSTINPSYNFCTGPYGTMTGGLDEVRIWNIARTQAEINADYRRSIAPSTNGLVAYWPMSREDGSDVYDVTCAHIPVHLSANYTWTTTPAAPVADVVPLDYAVQGIYPRHRLTTSYAFNSSNNFVQIKSPDGGASYFWYDRLSRLIASQNEEQRTPHNNINPNRYMYTEYDKLGQITEVGEKVNGEALSAPGYLEQLTIDEFQASGTNTQITSTIYDQVPTGNGVQTALLQDNLRKRISASLFKELETGPVVQASYYSYDLTGNVKTLWQQVEGLDLKRLDYEYDLVNSKPNFISYQNGKNDQFYYSFKYDANNQLTEAFSGVAAMVKPHGGSYLLDGRLDAFYQYYLHGPQARIELGHNKVQGLDYAYTLQGWTKGINGDKLNAMNEMGNDDNPVARDVMAYSLGYYNNDYKPIGTGANAFSLNYNAQLSDASGNELFNGNISNTTVALSKFRNGDPIGYSYRYDQLNRLKATHYHPLLASTTTWHNNTKATDNTYGENITYDANGNITAYKRNGIINPGNTDALMDNLTYVYPELIDPVNNLGYKVNNQLHQVGDNVPENKFTQALNGIEDIDNQTNYQYDKIGNLVKDQVANATTDITWTVYGKIKSITKTETNKITTITYSYDPAGNRVRKTVSVNEGGNTTTNTTWYTRDAQGNSLGIYSDMQNNQAGIWWKEQHLYGNKRLGMWAPGININTTDGSGEWTIFGKTTYELSNHLGNILATVTDKRIAVPSSENSSVADHYEADVTTTQDYYSSGMLMPGRKWSMSNYRYGFNGKENDNEMKGEGNSIDFGDRVYDPRIGKLLSVDYKSSSYPSHSPYSYAAGNPILYIDPDGNSVEPSNIIVTKERGTSKFKVTGDIVVKIQVINLSAKATKDLYIYDYISKVKGGLSDILNTPATYSVTTDVDMRVGGKGTASNKLIHTGKPREAQWTYDFNVTVQIELIDSKEKIRDDAHVLAIVDGYTPRPSVDIEGHPMITPIGVSNGNRIATVGVEEIANMKVDAQLHTALHELAHSLGVSHFWNKKPGDYGTPNLMDYKYINNSLTDKQLITDLWFSNLLTPNFLLQKLNNPKPWSQEKEKFSTSSKDELEKTISKNGIQTSR
ncbi:LamG-like jellyroll fold domain-containing protein [Longitalea arenae]|uniref:LamG-like jellyroll fold domain-containing protein n=1 Tax=Longitalea arenae TaxID=2812558 RepID=UPI00196842D2|nr:LamG-like jellyroll fold domain-containing protein [Longitalea arenae]